MPIHKQNTSINHQLLVIGMDALNISSWNSECNLLTFACFTYFLALWLACFNRSWLYALAH